MNHTGMLIIISGPSGSGKGTVVKALDISKNYALSISVTTREKREGEIEDKDYFFINMETFNNMRDTGQLLEHAVFCGNYYGTPSFYVEDQIAMGKTVVLEIEVNGALQVREKFKDCVLIFLIPPTMGELENRLTGRNTETGQAIEDRLKRAREEIKLIDKYDYLVINDSLDETVQRIDNIVAAESLKPHRSLEIIRKFKGDM